VNLLAAGKLRDRRGLAQRPWRHARVARAGGRAGAAIPTATFPPVKAWQRIAGPVTPVLVGLA